jgi:hypothetical protein
MRRRNFLQGLAASAGATVVPMPAMAKVATQTTSKVIPFHYGWACVYAQMNNGISAADIARVFRIPTADAAHLMDRMLTRGVIHPPGLDGRSHPTRAWQPWDKRTPAGTDSSRKATKQQDETRTPKALFRAVMAPVLTDPSFGWAA